MTEKTKIALLRKLENGSITADEYRKLELEAMQDDFLFDAIEGHSNQNFTSDDIRKRLYHRVKKKSSIRLWIPLAAAVMLIIFAGLWWNTLPEFSDQKQYSDLQTTEEINDNTPDQDAIASTASSEETNDDNSKEKSSSAKNQATQIRKENYVDAEADVAEDENVFLEGDLNTEYESSRTYSEKIADVDETDSEIGASVAEESAIQDEPMDTDFDNPGTKSENSFSTNNSAPASAPQSGTAAKKRQFDDNQVRTISGIVRDINGDPLIGANVFDPKTEIGVVTNLDGKFKLSIPENANNLVINYVGFQTKTITLADKISDLEISMKELEGSLSEVVVSSLPKPAAPVKGWQDFDEYVSKNKMRNQEAVNNNAFGVVAVEFSVNKDGNPQNIKILESPGYGLGGDAIKLIMNYPDWKQGGKVYYEIIY